MIQNLKRDKAKFLEIIKMHVVVDNKLYVDTVKKQNEHKVSTFNILDGFLFNVKSDIDIDNLNGMLIFDQMEALRKLISIWR